MTIATTKTSMRRAACRAGLLVTAVSFALGLGVSSAQTTTDAKTPLQIAFTFDDLPAHGPLPPGTARPAVVNSILATLKRENMPPIYGFVNGFRVAQYPYQIHILQAWRAAGNPLGNHTWSHPEFDKLSVAQYETNIQRNEPLLRKVSPDNDWHWFRFPFLEEGDTIEKREQLRTWLSEHGYRIAEVSMDFQDYDWNEPYARCAAKHDSAAINSLHDSYLDAADESIRVYREIAETLYHRDVPYVLLMHVGAFDARMLPELIGLFRSRGFSFITLQQAMADPIYSFDSKIPSPGGNTFNELVAQSRNVNIRYMTDRSKELDGMCR
ncbi:MAG TPA: polysaccharide deacetylase family protein [Acidobacteriaceae bacterium]|nr:polysaccharide deacetylase family protein [Acidobacteriaceae bacterium]